MNFTIKKGIQGGIDITNSNYVVIWANGIIAFLASFLAAITIIGILAIPAIWIGYIESLLRIRRGGKVDFGAFFKVGFKQWWPLFVLVLLMFLGILAGFMLLIIPGVYLSVAWMFATYLKIDRDISISDAFGESRRLVSNSGWWLLFLYVLLLGVAGQILTLIPILNLVYIFVFPYFIMMQLEAYILVTDAENNSEN
jgi:hypothetical protein|tara:strand:- start:206 stop:796 length:591 start_codon:yes stop_codon:yes gene_type:complete